MAGRGFQAETWPCRVGAGDRSGVAFPPMSFFDSKHQRAAWMVVLLGLFIAIALAPYASGLLGAPVLYIILAPLHQWTVPKVRSRALASSLMIVVGLVGIVLPFSWMVSLLVGQAQDAANAVVNSPILDRLDTLTIGPYAIGQEIKELGSRLVGMMGGGAISLLGRVTRIVLNLVFAFTGLFFILQDPDGTWRSVRPYIPFSDENVTILLAEQNTNVALRYADYGYILENGRIVMDGEAKALRENEDVKEFYLGMGGTDRKSFRDVKSYKRRKRWLS